MKHSNTFLGILLFTALTFTSCTQEDDVDFIIAPIPTAQEFSTLKQDALDALTQEFSFNTEDGVATFTSNKGVSMTIQGGCLTLNGNSITGQVDIKYIELFDKGNMLTTNKSTMGALPNGDKALLISGGEFLIEATQGGQTLETSCGIQLIIPSGLTGGADNGMLIWEGRIDEDDNLTWDQVEDATGQGGVFANGDGEYYAFLQEFGWSNVDRFYSDPRPKTTILVQAPSGYNYTNSAVYLSYDGEDTGLAGLDTFENNLFSEHYGQIPIGLECHVIFVSEDNGNWRYAIKAVTIVEGGIITFSINETSTSSESGLVALINALP